MTDTDTDVADDERTAETAVATETRQMRRALVEIRREGWKVAVIYATVDAALVALLANLVVSLLQPGFVPDAVPIPAALVGGAVADPALAGSAVVGVALGLAVFVAEVVLRVRRPLVEQFEAVNPGLHESLRTARDVLDDGTRSRMAPRLYRDVVDDLREASSIGLLDLRRLTATVAVVVLVSLASIQVAVIDVSLGGDRGPDGDGPADGGVPSDYGGLQDPAGILGDPEDIPSGEENLDAIIDTSGSGGADRAETDAPAAYDSSGFAGDSSVEGQRAGFAEGEQLEDAELIREYNLRIREEGDG